MIFSIGGCLVVGAFAAWWIALRACQRIVRATSHRDGGLTYTDAWLNTRQFQKRRKLREIVAFESDPILRNDASRALHFEAIGYALFVSGVLLMVIGVAA